MSYEEWLAQQFELQRPRLHAVAYRMLGSVTEAEDAVQNAWLRLSRVDAAGIDNIGGWLTTVVGRECLHALRTRRRRREELVDSFDTDARALPDPLIIAAEAADPEHEAVVADSLGLALLMVLDSLAPAERLAFGLHDMFGLPYDEIAPLVGRTSGAARQLASRGRRRVRGADLRSPDRDPVRQRQVVDAFYAATNAGDFTAIIELLDPEVVFRADYGSARTPALYRGAATVAKQARRARGADLRPVVVNGLPGVVTSRDGQPVSIMSFTIVGARIVEIYGIRDPERVRRLAGHLIPARSSE